MSDVSVASSCFAFQKVSWFTPNTCCNEKLRSRVTVRLAEMAGSWPKCWRKVLWLGCSCAIWVCFDVSVPNGEETIGFLVYLPMCDSSVDRSLSCVRSWRCFTTMLLEFRRSRWLLQSRGHWRRLRSVGSASQAIFASFFTGHEMMTKNKALSRVLLFCQPKF